MDYESLMQVTQMMSRVVTGDNQFRDILVDSDITRMNILKKLRKEVIIMADTFRKEYAPLDEEQKSNMNAIKDKAQELLDLFDSTVSPEERSDRSRCMAIARTNLETTIMWAIKGVTSAKTNQR